MANIGSDMYEKFSDGVKNLSDAFVLVLAGTADEKPKLLCACSKAAIDKGAHSGKIVKDVAALTDGKGGGRPETAMAGVGDKSKIAAAIEKAAEIVAGYIK